MEEANIKIILDPTRLLDERGQVLEGLLASEPRPSIDFLKGVLRVEDIQMRLLVLAKCHSSRANIGIDLAERLLFDSAEQVRSATVPLLSFLPDQDRNRLLLRVALSDSSQDNRQVALSEIGQQGLVDLAPKLMTELDRRVADIKKTEPIPAQLNEPLRSYLVNLIGTLKALRFFPANSLLSHVARVEESVLAPLRIPAVQALGAMGPQAVTELEAIFQHHRQSWTTGDPQIQDAARTCLGQLRAYPNRQRAALLLDICLDPERGPHVLAKQILVTEGWLTSSLSVVVDGLGREGARQFCKEIIAQWLGSEQFQVSVYKALTSSRLTGDACREASLMVLESEESHPVPATTDAVPGVIETAVRCLSEDEPHRSRAERVLDRLASGEDCDKVYDGLLDRANAHEPLRSAVQKHIMSRATPDTVPLLPHKIRDRVAEAGPGLARRYAFILEGVCRDWYKKSAKPMRQTLLAFAGPLVKASKHAMQGIGRALLRRFEEIERTEFEAVPDNRTLADHPLLDHILNWVMSNKVRLAKCARDFLVSLSKVQHADPCFSCFALVSGATHPDYRVREISIDAILTHGAISDGASAILIERYAEESEESLRARLIEVFEQAELRSFLPTARNAVLDRTKSDSERVALVSFLRHVFEPASIQHMNRLLTDPKEAIIEASLDALKQHGDDSSIEPLVELKTKATRFTKKVDAALIEVVLRHQNLLQSNDEPQIVQGLQLWQQAGIRVDELIPALKDIIENQPASLGEMAAELWASEGFGRAKDLPFLEKWASEIGGHPFDTVRHKLKQAIHAIKGDRIAALEKQLLSFKDCGPEIDWWHISEGYTILGPHTCHRLVVHLEKYHRTEDPSMAVIVLNAACEALAKHLFGLYGESQWGLTRSQAKRWKSKSVKQVNRIEWLQSNLSDVSLDHLRYIDDLRRISEGTHDDIAKKPITDDERAVANERFFQALLWVISACESPPSLKTA